MPKTDSSIKNLNARLHLGYLDGVRGVAAVFVVIHHMWLEAGLRFQPFGHYAVGLFIVLSGFCLMLPVVRNEGVLKGGSLSFYKRRARRILPPYYAAMALSLVLIWLFLGNQVAGHYDECYDVNLKGILTHLFLVHHVFESTSTQINAPFWSVAVEWWIYFLFPVLVVLARRWGMFKTVVSTVVLAAGLTYLLLPTPFNMSTHGISPAYLALFTFGMLAASIVFSDKPLFASLRQRVPWTTLLFTLMAVLVALIFPVLGEGKFVSHHISDYLVGVGSVALLVIVSNPTTWFYKIFSLRPLVFFGTFAYSIYLVHFPLVRLLWQYLIYPWNLPEFAQFALLVIVGLPVLLLLCYLFFLGFERPFLTRPAAPAASSGVPVLSYHQDQSTHSSQEKPTASQTEYSV